ncbi:hypothetical protein CYMTET_43797 [Cymbomonas tetramitiformis]|uniref:Uncharacterized protein n=1 Tax=Cymbomonas tetramitiformis TaxID=36881 RepID=A0AAE0C2R2_9CHLO|nr:hypothetical protein CYMTET_43797 [Cymbomonas tetramitiformis]
MGNESNAAAIFAKLSATLMMGAFTVEDMAFTTLFTLDDAAVADGKRVLLEFARRLLHTDAPFQGTSGLLSMNVLANEDPQEAIADFNGVLTAARRRDTFDDDEVAGVSAL